MLAGDQRAKMEEIAERVAREIFKAESAERERAEREAKTKMMESRRIIERRISYSDPKVIEDLFKMWGIKK